MNCLCSIRAQNAPKFGVFRSPPTATRRSYGAGDLFQRFGSVPWHLESMNKYLSRCQTAALGALMSCARSAVAPQVHLFGRWRKRKSGASRRCGGDFKICWSSQRMETVLPRPVTTRCAESASHCTAGWIALAQFAPKTRPSLVCLDHRQRPRGAHMEQETCFSGLVVSHGT